MPKTERRLKYQEMPAGTIMRSAVRGGSMDHGAMTGLGDPDHPQYLLTATLFPSVRVFNSGAITIGNAPSPLTPLTFDSEDWDTAGFHSTTTNTSRLTVPVGYSGTYLITGTAQFEANATGQRIYELLVNGTSKVGHIQNTDATAANRMASNVLTLYQLDDDDYVELTVYQNSGGNLDVRAVASWSPYFMMIRLGPK
jgi:hypothetical protein